MPRPRRRITFASALAGSVVISLFATVGASASHSAAASRGTQPRIGNGALTPAGSVDLSNLPATVPGSTSYRNSGPLERNGKPNSLPSRPSSGAKSAAGAGAATVNSTAGAHVTGPLCNSSCIVHNSHDGIQLSNSNCGCQPPDINAAIGPKNVVEAVNLDLAVYKTGGRLQKSTGLNTFFGTSLSLSDPRVLYDNAWNRFVLSVTVIPASSSSTPLLLVAASESGNPTGKWWKFAVSFSYTAGTLLDYPQLGMDSDAIIISTNNFCCGSSLSYANTAAFAIAKQALYNGKGFGFGAFGVAFSTQPSMVAGIPQQEHGKTYLLAADTSNGGQLDVYYMTNSSRPDSTAVTLEATPAMAYTPPSRRVNQPGTSVTLDPLDGRIDWAGMQNGGNVWFAHGVNLAGFPGIQYGEVTVGGSDSVTTSTAFHSSSSDDFNPSIGVTPEPGSCATCVDIWLNWAYDDAPNGIATSDTVNTVGAGGGIPSLVGTDTTLVTGSITNETRFGDYSSVAINPVSLGSCTAGSSAEIAQMYFGTDGSWHTRLAEVGMGC